jgi:hypothetical protein
MDLIAWQGVGVALEIISMLSWSVVKFYPESDKHTQIEYFGNLLKKATTQIIIESRQIPLFISERLISYNRYV